jgi:diketogulonate reductase-like aldo/keto reductase
LLPWLRARGILITAYSPIEQPILLRDSKLANFARENDMMPAHAALAQLLNHDDVIVIPKTGHRERLKENTSAQEHQLTQLQLAELDRLYPPPAGPRSLEMLRYTALILQTPPKTQSKQLFRA